MKRKAGASRSAGGFCKKSTRSLPAVKHSAPPLMTMTRTCSSAAAALSVSLRLSYMALVRALYLSGRFRVIARQC
ncbi:hypothetical protein D3C75_1308830 [compost metagenome]